MTLSDIENALKAVTSSTSHYSARNKPDKYIVWAEDGQAGSLWADGKMQEQVLTGTVDYFTRTENDPNFEAIQAALNDLEISWRLESIQYEDETKYIHYEWVWEMD